MSYVETYAVLGFSRDLALIRQWVSAYGQWPSQLPLSWRSSKVMFDSWTHLIVLDVLLPLILTTALFLGIITGEETGLHQGQMTNCHPAAQSCSTLWHDSWNCIMPGFPVLHPLPELLMFTKACSFSQRCHPTIRPLLVSSPPTFSLSQHQGLFQWVGSSNQVVRKYWASASVLVLPVNIHGWFPLGLTGLISFLSKGL